MASTTSPAQQVPFVVGQAARIVGGLLAGRLVTVEQVLPNHYTDGGACVSTIEIATGRRRVHRAEALTQA